ncbi:MAG: hypothetical protein ACK575_02250 [Cyanobacteriota bacterium]
MRRLFAVLLTAFLLFGWAPAAHADIGGLTPSTEKVSFKHRARAAKTDQAKARIKH